MRAIRIDQWGGPEVLRLVEDAPVPSPGEDEVLIEVARAGINFADTHTRENAYVARYTLPLVPGAEVVGRVAEAGGRFAVGDRVVALTGGQGGYAQYAVARADRTFPVAEDVSDGTALALLLQGLTAWHLYRTCARVAEGETVVVISGAGGVGSLAVQLGKPMGAGRIIATASSAVKWALCESLGADVALDAAREDLSDALREANDGRGVDAAFETAGGPVFEACLDALAPFGRIVVCGIASKEQNELRTGRLLRKSHSVIGFWLMHCLGRPEMVDEPLADLAARVARGELRVIEGTTYPLSEVRRAHEDLVARRTTGKLLLDPSA